MITGLVDHLWQSCCCCGVAWAFSTMTRWQRRSRAPLALANRDAEVAAAVLAAVRARRVAGISRRRTARIRRRRRSSRSIGLLAPFASPARLLGWSGLSLALATLAALAGAAACAYGLRSRLRIERERALEEVARRERDIDDVQTRPGFICSALLSAVHPVRRLHTDARGSGARSPATPRTVDRELARVTRRAHCHGAGRARHGNALSRRCGHAGCFRPQRQHPRSRRHRIRRQPLFGDQPADDVGSGGREPVLDALAAIRPARPGAGARPSRTSILTRCARTSPRRSPSSSASRST